MRAWRKRGGGDGCDGRHLLAAGAATDAGELSISLGLESLLPNFSADTRAEEVTSPPAGGATAGGGAATHTEAVAGALTAAAQELGGSEGDHVDDVGAIIRALALPVDDWTLTYALEEDLVEPVQAVAAINATAAGVTATGATAAGGGATGRAGIATVAGTDVSLGAGGPCDDGAGWVPAILSVTPRVLCTNPPLKPAAATADSTQQQEQRHVLQLRVSCLDGIMPEVLLRCQGSSIAAGGTPTTSITTSRCDGSGGNGTHDVADVVLAVRAGTLPPLPGLLLVEARRPGGGRGCVVPVLLLDEPGLAEELQVRDILKTQVSWGTRWTVFRHSQLASRRSLSRRRSALSLPPLIFLTCACPPPACHTAIPRPSSRLLHCTGCGGALARAPLRAAGRAGGPVRLPAPRRRPNHQHRRRRRHRPGVEHR